MRDFGVRWHELDDIPAEFVDQLMLASAVEAEVLEEMRHKG